MTYYNLISFLGIFGLMGLAWLCSTERRRMNWRAIGGGTLLMLLFAGFIFLVPFGSRLFLGVNDVAVKVLNSSTAGAQFIFGRLALPPGTTDATGQPSFGFFFAFQALPAIIFFSALMSVLYYLKVMPLLLRGFAWLFSRFMRISGAEALCTASNIFVGVESALTIKPYLEKMTRSELCVVLTAGMATVASNVLAVYIFSLQQYFPTIAGHLISASIIAAPASIVMSKIVVPEDGKPLTLGRDIPPFYERESTLFEAIINGANAGVKLIVGIVALLVAVLGLVALVDLLLGWIGGGLNSLLGVPIDWSLKGLAGCAFYPVTLMMGVPADDAVAIAGLIGERSIVTEVVAYQDLAGLLSRGMITHPRSVVIATYALCGFAHVASIAIFVGGTASLVPSRMKDLAGLGVRSLIAATLACLMTGCVAGTFYMEGMSVLGK